MTNFLHVKESLRVRVRRSRVYWEGRRGRKGKEGMRKPIQIQNMLSRKTVRIRRREGRAFGSTIS